MKISICITVFNEENTIARLLDSLINQTRDVDEILLVDGGSKDKTAQIIRHYQKKDKSIKLLVQKCSRAEGRNLGVETAKAEIIAMTDAGCIPRRDWLEKIIEPFLSEKIEVVAGFYEMIGQTPMQKAERIFLGVTPERFDMVFLPSTRSIAFRKSVWEKVGGFPENLEGAAEDTIFNYKLVKAGAKISRMKNAVVEWGMPETLSEFFSKIEGYAKGDAGSKIWFFPSKGLASHNIKAISIFGRYVFGFILLFLGFNNKPLLAIFFICIFAYLIFAFRKAGFWGIILQFTSDFAVMSGFVSGILK